jgi:putative component of membrane protein insertase Oxa1/YidC/SpoIIIJ protein YidD
MLIILITVFLFSHVSFSQTDLKRWEKQEIFYEKPVPSKRDYSIAGENLFDKGVQAFVKAYWILFSDADGDNCPFHPSCSSFLIESVKETNILQGTLMFADRFTRDMNFYQRETRYSLIKGGRFFDPASNYILKESEIIFKLPPEE